MDPSGNEALHHDCSLRVESTGLHYSWTHEGNAIEGQLRFEQEKLFWQDAWHQPEAKLCQVCPEAWGLCTARFEYGPPGETPWGWRIMLSQRPDETLVLQMTNITPWGEEGRALRMLFTQQEL